MYEVWTHVYITDNILNGSKYTKEYIIYLNKMFTQIKTTIMTMSWMP